MVTARKPLRATRKGTLTWMARGVASHATRLYAISAGADKCVAVCGYPRSGTSWISAALSRYYDLPVPRHYQMPQFYPQVLHGHDLRLGKLRRIFYVLRTPYELFPSLFVKRFGISRPTAADRGHFGAFLKAELAHPHEAPCPWADHLATACRRYGAASVLFYTRDPLQMTDQLEPRIATFDGYCDRARLIESLNVPRVGASAPTTATSSPARRFDWFTPESHLLIEAEIARARIMCPTLKWPDPA